MALALSILDQSPITYGGTATEALRETGELVQLAEKWGYTRYWVAEHHDTSIFAGSSPEILVAHLATLTTKIRVGTGGIMLPHYAAYKVAENIKLLGSLFPGRIDAGIGRAPGGMPRATYALHDGKYRDVHQFPQQVDDLLMYLHNLIPATHRFQGLQATPIPDQVPPVWMLGSSHNSALLAAEKGLPYMFAHFINGDGGEAYAAHYREQFQPSIQESQATCAVAIFLACAETEEEAERVASSLDYGLVKLEQGRFSNDTSPKEIEQYHYTEYEEMRRLDNRKRMVVGTPIQVKEQIEELAKNYAASEVMLVMRTHNFEDKKNAYRLVAKAFA